MLTLLVLVVGFATILVVLLLYRREEAEGLHGYRR
jgi:hypothetical protein